MAKLISLLTLLFFCGFVVAQQTRPRDPSSTFSNLGSGSTADGVHVYCSDCTKNSDPCTGSGSGAEAYRINGAWVCGSASSPPFTDSTAIVKGSGDATKLLRLEVDTATSGATRVWTIPDFNQAFFAFASTSTNVTVDDTYYFLAVDASGANRTETLPACVSGNAGRTYYFKKTDSSVNTVTIAPDGTDTIDGGPNLIFEYAGKARAVVCNGSGGWLVQ